MSEPIDAERILEERKRWCDEAVRFWSRQLCATNDSGARESLEAAHRMHGAVAAAATDLRSRVHTINQLRGSAVAEAAPPERGPSGPPRTPPPPDRPFWSV